MGKIKFFGAIMLLSLFIQSWQFAAEKAFYADAAFYLFSIVNNEQLPIEHYRFASALAYVPAFIAHTLHADFETIIKLFSSGIWLYLIGIFALIVYLKRQVEALVLVVCLVFFTRESFFIASEVPIAVAWALTFGAFVNKYLFEEVRLKRSEWIIGVIAAFAAVFSHPIGIGLIVFFMLVALVCKGFKWKNSWQLILIIVLPLIVKSVFFSFSSYEMEKLSLDWSKVNPLILIQQSYAAHFFKNAYGGLYIVVFILWILMVVSPIKLKLGKSYSVLVFLVFPILYLIVTYIWINGDANPGMERAMMLIAVPIVYLYFFQMHRVYTYIRGGVMFLLWIVGIWSIGKIMDSSEPYSKRLYYLDKMVVQQMEKGGGKFYIIDDELDKEIWLAHWALSFESVLMSIRKNKIANTAVCPIKNNFSQKLESDRFHGPSFYYPQRVDSLNMRIIQLDENQWIKY
jgi:hypothetical protein